MLDHNHFLNLLRDPFRPRQYERLMQTLTVLRRSHWASALTKGKVVAKHATEKCENLAREALETEHDKSTAQHLYIHSRPGIQNLAGDQ